MTRYALLALLALGACVDEIDAEHDRWDYQRIASYHYTRELTCDQCSGNTVRPKLITVVANRVTSTIYSDTGEMVDILESGVTIDCLFDQLEDDRNLGLATFDVQFDPTLHYPTFVFSDPGPMYPHETDTLRLTNLVRDD